MDRRSCEQTADTSKTERSSSTGNVRSSSERNPRGPALSAVADCANSSGRGEDASRARRTVTWSDQCVSDTACEGSDVRHEDAVEESVNADHPRADDKLVHLRSDLSLYRRQCELLRRQLLRQQVTDLAGGDDSSSPIRRQLQLSERCAELTDVNNLLRGQLHAAQDENDQLLVQLEAAEGNLRQLELVHGDERRQFLGHYSSDHARLLLIWKQAVDVRGAFNQLRISAQQDILRFAAQFQRWTSAVVESCRSLDNADGASALPHLPPARTSCNCSCSTSDVETETKIVITSDVRAGDSEELMNLRAQLVLKTREAADREVLISSLQKQLSRAHEQLRESSMEVTDSQAARDTVEQVRALLREENTLHTKSSELGGIPILVSSSSLTNLSTIPPADSKNALEVRSEGDNKDINSSVLNVDDEVSDIVAEMRACFYRSHSQTHSLQLQNTELTSQLNATRLRLTQLELSYEQLEKQLEQSRDQLMTVQIQNDSLSRDLEVRRQEVHSQADEIERKERQITSLDKDNVDLSANLKESESKLHELELKLENTDFTNTHTSRELELVRLRLNESLDVGLRKEEKIEILSRAENEMKEEISKLKLEYDILLRDNCTALESLAKVKLDREELIAHVSRLTAAEASLKNSLLKITNQNEGLSVDKNDMYQLVQQLSSEQALLRSSRSALEVEVLSLQERLERVQQENDRISSEKMSAQEKTARTEDELGALALELRDSRLRCSELESRLNMTGRQKETTTSQIVRVQADFEQARADVSRLENELHVVSKKNIEMQSTSDSLQTDNVSLREQLAAVRADYLNVEMQLYEARNGSESAELMRVQLQDNLRQLEAERDQLKQQCASVQRAMNADVERLSVECGRLKHELAACTDGSRRQLAEANTTLADTVVRLQREKDEALGELEEKLRKSTQSWTLEHEEIVAQKENAVQSLRTEINRMSRTHESQLKAAEDGKQQALSMALQEHTLLQNSLCDTKTELDKCRSELTKLKSELSTQNQLHRHKISTLQTDLSRLQEQSESKENLHKKEMDSSTSRLNDLKRLRETSDEAMIQVKRQLAVVENQRDRADQQVNELTDKLQRMETRCNQLEAELAECKKTVQEKDSQCTMLQGTNEALRDQVKHAESSRSHMSAELDSCRDDLKALEVSKTSTDEEVRHLRIQMNDLENIRSVLKGECEDLKRNVLGLEARLRDSESELRNLDNQLAGERDNNTARQNEIYQLQQQNASVEEARNELARKLVHAERLFSESEEKLALKGRELSETIEDGEKRVRQCEQNIASLQEHLNGATDQVNELQLKLTSAETDFVSVKTERDHLQAQAREQETQLRALGSCLLRLPGLRFDNTISQAQRLADSSGGRLTERSAVGGCTGSSIMFDLDPTVLKSYVDDLVKELTQLKHQRDDGASRLHSAEQELRGARFSVAESQRRLEETKDRLNNVLAEKEFLDTRVSVLSADSAKHQELSKNNQLSASLLQDKLSRMEKLNAHLGGERQQLEDKLGALRLRHLQLESEAKQQRERADASEARIGQMETNRRAVEADLQRSQQLLQQRADELSATTNRLERIEGMKAAADSHIATLSADIERLERQMVDSRSDNERLNQENSSLHHKMSDLGQQLQVERERLQLQQRRVQQEDRDRSVLMERVAALTKNSNELKRHGEQLTERTSELQRQLTDERSARLQLEQVNSSTLKERQQNEAEGRELTRQLHSLQAENARLSDALHEMRRQISEVHEQKEALNEDNEHLEQGKTVLMQALDKVELERLRIDEDVQRSSHNCTLLTHKLSTAETRCDQLQMENSQLQQKLSMLQRHKERSALSGVDNAGCVSCKQHARQLDDLQVRCVKLEHSLKSQQMSHEQRVAGLQQQVASLQQQLRLHAQKRHQYISRSWRAGQEIGRLRSALDDSLRTVSGGSAVATVAAAGHTLDAAALEAGLRRLDATIAGSTGGSATPRPASRHSVAGGVMSESSSPPRPAIRLSRPRA